MTREGFDGLYLNKAVHCDTEEKANHFLALADSVGYKWNDKRELINYSLWEQYKKETCYEVTKGGFRFANAEFFKCENYQVIKYQPQLKLKEGDKVRVRLNNSIYSIDGKIGVVERGGFSRSRVEYVVKVCDELWYLTENELEKVEEPTYKEETIDDIIKEIKSKWNEINILLNRLETKKKGE